LNDFFPRNKFIELIGVRYACMTSILASRLYTYFFCKVSKNFIICSLAHCKHRLVVSTAEWLPWLHGLLGTRG